MPYPSLVTPASNLGNAVSQNGFGFSYLQNLYLFLADGSQSASPIFHAFQSTDLGLSWGELDAGAAPVYPSGGQVNQGFPVHYTVARDGSKVFLLWLNSLASTGPTLNWTNFTISQCVFDLTLGSWGSVTTVDASFMGLCNFSTSTPFPAAANPRAFLQLLVKSHGVYILYISGVNDIEGGQPVARCAYVTYNGASFGSAVQLPGQDFGNFYFPAGAMIDSAGRTHFLLTGGTFDAPGNSAAGIVWHLAMDTDLVFGVISQITTVLSTAANSGPSQISQPIQNLSTIAFATGLDDGFGNDIPTLFSAPLALNPTFTLSPITADQSAATQDFPRFSTHAQIYSVGTNGTDIVVAWMFWDGSPAPVSKFFYAKSRAGSLVWDAPVDVIDVPADSNLYVACQAATFEMTGGFGLLGFSLGRISSAPYTQFGFIPGSLLLTFLNCAGAVGVPYSCPFIPSGGTPPYTSFTIVSGTLPPGLTLNPTTGIVTGTPTTGGTFTFVGQVTDSDLNTATTLGTIIISGTIKPVGGGGSTSRGQSGLCVRPINLFDVCLFQEIFRVQKITFPDLCTIPEKYRACLPFAWGGDGANTAVPEQAVPFSRIGSIVTPDSGAGDVLVAQERVPYGYDGLMMAFFTSYTGQGFEQGSGDIVWRLQLNQRYLRELGNLDFAVGSSQFPFPLTEGQILLSGQLMRLVVNVPNLSGNIQVGGSRILGGLVGFYWPR